MGKGRGDANIEDRKEHQRCHLGAKWCSGFDCGRQVLLDLDPPRPQTHGQAMYVHHLHKRLNHRTQVRVGGSQIQLRVKPASHHVFSDARDLTNISS